MKQVPFSETIFFNGQGPLLLAKLNAAGLPMGFREVGDASELMLSPKTTSDDRNDHRTGARALLKRMTNTVGMDISFKLDSAMNPENLAMAMRASYTVKAAGTVTAEAHTLYAGCVCPTNYINITDDVTLVVKGVGGTPPTYVKDTDYTVYDHGIVPIAGSDLADLDTGDGVPITIDYAYAKQTVFECLTEAAQDYALRFEGLNTADDNKAVIVEIYRVGVDLVKQFGMITDKAIPLDISGSALLDPTKTTGSKYYRVILAG
jgi:hypothetical protein